MATPRQNCLGVLVAALLATGAGSTACGRRPAVTPATAAQVNRGVALMGQFDYDGARAAFAAAAEHSPDRPTVLVDLAIATLNRQQEGDEEAATALLRQVVEDHPDDLRARYCSGLLMLRGGNAAAALAHLEPVAEADPGDADAAYWTGQCLMDLERFDEALSWFRRALDRDPRLRSAAYRAFQALQRLGRRDEAGVMLRRFQALQDDPRARLAEYKYTRMGRKAEVVTLDAPSAPPAPRGPLFAAAAPLAPRPTTGWQPGRDASRPIACDLDGDGRLDLVIPGALDGGNERYNAVLLQTADASFALAVDHPLAHVAGVRTVLFGDFDDDGRTDAYLCRRGPNQLWRQNADGSWSDTTAATATAGGDHDTVDGAFYDADHDGDLDLLLVNADTGVQLLANNRDGSFRPLGAEQGLGEHAGGVAVVVADLDRDRDADLVVIHRRPPHEVLRNDLLWRWSPAPGFDAFRAADIAAAVAADLDCDGRPELVTAAADGSVSRWAETDGGWQATPLAAAPTAPTARPQLAVADIDGNGEQELVGSTAAGWRVVGGSAWQELASGRADGLVAWSLVALAPERGSSLVAWSENGPLVWAPGPGRWPFVALTLSGRVDTAASMRSNASGIGTRVAARVDSRWTVLPLVRASSGPGQGLAPRLVGLGEHTAVDFVALDWSDGVYQTELNLAPGTVHHLVETQRQLSSCPVLFAFDGRGFAFVSDLLGVAGLGYAVAPGEYAPPRPWERFLLPAGLVRPHDGRLLLKLAEPMEEVAYLDAARLTSWDVPPGWSMTVDERMAVAGPQPTGEPLFYRRMVLPSAARNDRGEDVTAAVTAVDRRAAPVGEVDARFIGMLRRPHRLELTFPVALDRLPGRPVLLADGWIEYPYSQTSFAAWQAHATYQAPTLEARGGDGRWRVLAAHFGYPAGMPRQMALPLPPLPAGTRALRLTTNQEIYWDRLAVAAAEPCPSARHRSLPLAAARLATVGFARRSTGPQRLPAYDDAHPAPLWDTRSPAGRYTELGPVDGLLAATDDALAVFGPGEAVEMAFRAPPPPPDGWQQRLVLEVDGWCKDMDLYTRDGATVAPLPSAGRSDDAAAALMAATRTRWRGGAD